MENYELLRHLEDNLQKARQWRERASAEFDSAIQALPAGRPDRQDRLAAASKEYSLALEAVNLALREYNDLVVFKKKHATASPLKTSQRGESAD